MLNFIEENLPSIIGFLGAFGIVVEVSPIKLYPLRWIGNLINADIRERLEYHIKESDKKEMKNLRHQILTAADELENGAVFSKEKYEHLIDANKDYHSLIDKYDFDNGYLDARFEYIMKKFKEQY
ncbi:hypothetical protein CWE04_12000 [Thomasclavelia cocleata]|uniref:Uncharacterized protein n=1 Tax=Thomasclavelia cocleata TaxID=69824 RepID=A0A1I0BPD6_9FIRM|nr:hypothetical protein [Thomasclavelia cocleata]MCR1960178.1 hypothetical protein [Thomasclavelia cocleata]NDO41848.1 hypothetical protein [Thomasclavelia cocleata]PJN79925.1 hypothetical protein CWE04_12000 [Thomasclavelia cocleata]SET08172.1 hypothetical protein SAMN04489758_101189 [Thomasclavelia cocleata]